MLAILNAQVEFKENPKDHTYEVKPNSFPQKLVS